MKSDVGVIILAGGFGSRVKKQLGSVPKPLANTMTKPFLYWIIGLLKYQGFCNIILATHYEHKKFDQFLSNLNYDNLNITLVNEESPLGTGGAVINAIVKANKKYKYYLILNGDSILTEKFENLWQCFDKSNIDGSLFAVYLNNTERFGRVEFDREQLLKGFVEKKPGKGYINAGVYFFKYKFIKNFLNKIQNFSLEREFFPKIITDGYKIKTVLSTADFIDIGTPKSLFEAESFIKNHSKFIGLMENK